MNPQLALPQKVTEVLHLFEQSGHQIYIVGGVVRDLLLGKPTTDWDFTTDAPPEKILQILGKEAFYDNSYGTVGIKYAEFDKPFEITTFRTEHGYSDNRRPDRVEWGKNLKEDLSRRDFTINAMALGRNLLLIDPHGGSGDLKNKIIRAVGNPGQRFNEDALRMLRAIRIAAQLGFTIDTATLEAIKQNSKLIQNVAFERTHDELMKIFSSDYPADGYQLLRSCALGQELLPEMELTFGVQQKSPGRHHIYDVGTHSVETLRYCQSPDPVTRFAALVHDSGKVKTQHIYPNGKITFYNHEMESAKIAQRLADRFKFSRKEKDKFVKLVRWHQFTMDDRMTDSAVRRIIRNVGVENVPDLISLRIGDRIGSGANSTSWRFEKLKQRFIEVQKQPFAIPDLKVNGRDVMKIKKIPSGPLVGKYLQYLFAEVTQKEVENERKTLLDQLSKLVL